MKIVHCAVVSSFSFGFGFLSQDLEVVLLREESCGHLDGWESCNFGKAS
jgi:hypothetical protein